MMSLSLFQLRRIAIVIALIVAGIAGWSAWNAAGHRFRNLWSTPTQQGDRFMARKDFKTASERYTDPLHRGVALFRAGEFKEAAAEFGRDSSAEGHFNRGNALVMAGQYEPAMTSYDEALHLRNDWEAAVTNRSIAAARLKKLHPPNDGSEGTEGQLKADKIVFDNKPKQSGAEQETQVVSGGAMSDDEIQAMWLRQVKTTPADFLRAKFAWQLQRKSEDTP